MEKLTLQYLILYPEAKVQCYGEKINYRVTFIDKVNERVWLRTKLFELGDNRDDIAIEDCKLILRPLSSLTEEENKIYASLIEGYHINDIWTKIETKESADYLRSISIDIDNLQEKGAAVYE